MSAREPVDFFIIRPGHEEVHAQLLNWSAWCRGGSRGGSVHPMFRQYRNDYFEAMPAPQECDTLAAQATQKAFTQLPERHRWVIQWSYVKPYIPVMKVRRALGLTTQALADLLHDGRTMMKNVR